MTTTTTRIGLALAVALAGFGAAGLAQGTPEEPAPSEAMPELIYPEIDAPAAPTMTEDEAAAQEPTPDAEGASGVNDLTPPDMSAPRSERAHQTCPDREERPAWAEDLGVKEVIRSLLLSEIYKARSYEQIVATGDCSCAVKAPSWDAADTEYEENYAALDLGAVREARGEFQRLSGSFYNEARRICRAQGNW